MSKGKFHVWESALLLAFALTLTTGVWASHSQSALADRVVRLHVVAHSDSEADQALKLQVRDAVLARAGDALTGTTERAEAEARLSGQLQELADAAATVVSAAGYGYPVTVSLTDCWFPTRQYDTFALPAGSYRTLRVSIGEGAGQNWWCVVFPPLCLAPVVEETAETAGLTGEQVSLITGRDGGYVLKFKLLEWWESLMRDQ